MKVILLQDVKSLGKKGETVEVSEGYGRNFILTKKLGVEANNANINNLKLQKANEEKRAQEHLEQCQALAKQIEDTDITVYIKSGEGGRTFGSVSTKEIVKAAKDQRNLEIDKKKLVMKDPIKALGMYEVIVKLHPKVTAKLKVKVQEEA